MKKQHDISLNDANEERTIESEMNIEIHIANFYD